MLTFKNYGQNNFNQNLAEKLGWRLERFKLRLPRLSYTKQLADVLGVSLEETIIVSHRGFSACYFLRAK